MWKKKNRERCRLGNHFFQAFISEMDLEVRHDKLISLWLEVSLPSLSHPPWSVPVPVLISALFNSRGLRINDPCGPQDYISPVVNWKG